MPKIEIRSLLPYQVRTKDQDNFTEAYEKVEDAQADVTRRNTKAEELGLETRYHTVKNPNFDQDKLASAKKAVGIKVNGS